MAPTPPARLLHVVDAGVLIDYAIAERKPRAHRSPRGSPLRAPSRILGEVEQLTANDCGRIGSRWSTTTLDQLAAAAAPRRALSFEEGLRLLLEHAGGYTCVTNGKALRRERAAAAVPFLWGLELMVELVARQELASEAAMSESIRESNRHHITADVLARTIERIRLVSRDSRGTHI